MTRKNVIIRGMTFRQIDPSRWNHLLGEDKTTMHKGIPDTGLSVIIVKGRIKAVAIIDTEDIGGCDIIRSGQFEVIEE